MPRTLLAEVGSERVAYDGRAMTSEPAARPEAGTLRHDALFYRSDDDYVTGIRSFVEAGVAAGEPVLVAVPGSRLDLLRTALGASTELRFVDMAREGRNPGWIIPGVLHAFVEEHAPVRVRVVGEPIWPGRAVLAYPRCVQHEALINIALAGRPVSVLCPYDAVRLDVDVVADAASTHPFLIRDGDRQASAGYGRPESVVDSFNLPFPTPPSTASMLFFEAAGLSGMRAMVAALAREAGLDPDQVEDLRVAANEIATNAVVHSGRPAVARVWLDEDGLVCEITGSSVLTDRLAGRLPPSPVSDTGRGLLLVNYLCDLVQVHTDSTSTAIRLHMHRRVEPATGPAPATGAGPT
ncbi:sensor histidine kinase [Plantactinospora sp. KLBMP9567]|uniref:sensor histidine kinase n=1 Tax=Plantactinospora sp. KLBMP9567 TaxID=3085900 RepID=UPI002982119C|nr:sensor histidine kinase [Plantactinospora sp. KLBMP9567]MDW5325975.1 sensor histidine kinase [Plantactinospora sp. KLBMP9567]